MDFVSLTENKNYNSLSSINDSDIFSNHKVDAHYDNSGTAVSDENMTVANTHSRSSTPDAMFSKQYPALSKPYSNFVKPLVVTDKDKISSIFDAIAMRMKNIFSDNSNTKINTPIAKEVTNINGGRKINLTSSSSKPRSKKVSTDNKSNSSISKQNNINYSFSESTLSNTKKSKNLTGSLHQPTTKKTNDSSSSDISDISEDSSTSQSYDLAGGKQPVGIKSSSNKSNKSKSFNNLSSKKSNNLSEIYDDNLDDDYFNQSNSLTSEFSDSSLFTTDK